MDKQRGGNDDAERLAESKRVLARVDAESETLGTSTFVRMANRAGDHLTAREAEGMDAAEIWGRRVGRGLGAVAFVVLAVWLFNWLTR